MLKVGDFVDLQSGVPGKILSQISVGKGGFWKIAVTSGTRASDAVSALP